MFSIVKSEEGKDELRKARAKTNVNAFEGYNNKNFITTTKDTLRFGAAVQSVPKPTETSSKQHLLCCFES